MLELMLLSLSQKILNFRAFSTTKPKDESRDPRLVALVNEARSEHEQLQIARGH